MKKTLKNAAFLSVALMLFFSVLVLGAVRAEAQSFGMSTNYEFTTVNGATVTAYSSAYDMTVNVFGRVDCYNCEETLNSLVSSGVSAQKNIRINYIDIINNSKEVVSDFASSFSGSGINFCYDTSYGANNAMWNYAHAANMGNSISTPVVVYIKSDATIFQVTQGLRPTNEIYKFANGDASGEVLVDVSVTGEQNYDYAYDILDQINALRSGLHLGALKMDKELMTAAMLRAAELSVYYSHTRPSGLDCFSASGRMHGENIAIGYPSTASVMDGWTNSPGHYRNMTDTDFRSAGVGCFKASDGTWCWVQVFSIYEAEVVYKSGTSKTTNTFPAKYNNLSLDFYYDKDPHSLAVGDRLNLIVSNSEFASQIIDPSSFTFTTSDSSILSVASNGSCVVKGSGDVTVTATFKNSNIKLDQTISVGHIFTNDADTSCNVCGAFAYPSGNTLYKEGGKWYHVVNRRKVADTTLVKYGGKWYYVRGGVVDFSATTLVKYSGKWWYVNKGVVDFVSNTLVRYGGKWYHVSGGIVDFTSTTLVKYGAKWYYVRSGVVDFSATTLVKYSGKWYYVRSGVVDFGATTLVKYGGKWYYVRSGVVDFSATTLVKYGAKWYYVRSGVVDFSATTLVKYGAKWYYVRSGVVDFSATTLVKYGGKWYYVRSGVVDFGATTLVKYGSKWYYVRSGVVDFGATTLVKYGAKWYYVRSGIVDFSATTLVKYGGKWYYVRSGVVDFGATTLVKYGAKWYYVRGGIVDFTYSGKVLYGGKYYHVVKGIMQ